MREHYDSRYNAGMSTTAEKGVTGAMGFPHVLHALRADHRTPCAGSAWLACLRLLGRKIKRRSLLAACVTMGALGVRAEPAALEVHVVDSPALWSRTRDSWLTGETASWFRPVSGQANAELRYPGYSNSPAVTFLGHRLHEVMLKMGTNGLLGITMSMYNRGDAGDLSEARFTELVAALDRDVSAWSRVSGTERPAQRLSAAASIHSKAWALTNVVAEMKWSASRHAATAQGTKGFRAEYVQLVFTPRDGRSRASASGGVSMTGRSVSAMASKRNVRKDKEGFVYIDNIPMVDQGEKGYCAVATAERVLRYYGRNLDQHVLAQMAGTQAEGGTSPDEMLAVFRRIGLKLDVKVDLHYACSVRQILATVAKYNQQARKDNAAPIELGQGGVIDLQGVYRSMDLETLRRSRCEREQVAYKKFIADVVGSIDQGIPLAWSVMLGLVKEVPELPQASGGHMRIVFGYNKATKELLYTDSWGLGHERKTMSFDDAWTITTGLFSLDPRR
jgi:hypothetical protein